MTNKKIDGLPCVLSGNELIFKNGSRIDVRKVAALFVEPELKSTEISPAPIVYTEELGGPSSLMIVQEEPMLRSPMIALNEDYNPYKEDEDGDGPSQKDAPAFRYQVATPYVNYIFQFFDNECGDSFLNCTTPASGKKGFAEKAGQGNIHNHRRFCILKSSVTYSAAPLTKTSDIVYSTNLLNTDFPDGGCFGSDCDLAAGKTAAEAASKFIGAFWGSGFNADLGAVTAFSVYGFRPKSQQLQNPGVWEEETKKDPGFYVEHLKNEIKELETSSGEVRPICSTPVDKILSIFRSRANSMRTDAVLKRFIKKNGWSGEGNSGRLEAKSELAMDYQRSRSDLSIEELARIAGQYRHKKFFTEKGE